MDKRKTYYLVIDTETCPIDRTEEKVNPHNMLVYDIGFAVVDRKGKVYETHSLVIDDIFFKEEEKMKSSYYADKRSQYIQDLRNGSRLLVNFYTARNIIKNTIAKYNITKVFGYNMYFDYSALNKTMSYLTNDKYRSFFAPSVIICDILKMTRQTVANTPTYKQFCTDNQYLTKNNRVRATAEIVKRYIDLNTEFIESHTALEDVLIESQIMAYCFRKHKAMNYII